jgi:predicted ester cyclase
MPGRIQLTTCTPPMTMPVMTGRAGFRCALFAMALSIACKEKENKAPQPEATPVTSARTDTAAAARRARVDAGAVAPQPQPTTTPEAKLEREAECWSLAKTAQWSLLSRCFADVSLWEVEDGVPPERAQGPDAIVAALKAWRTAFPDIEMRQQLKLIKGEEIAAIYILNGKNLGPFMGRAATGKSVGVVLAALTTVGDDGKIRMVRLLYDQRAIWHQLGLRPDTAASAVVEDTRPERLYYIANDDAVEDGNVKIVRRATDARGDHNFAEYAELLADAVTFRSYGEAAVLAGKNTYLTWLKAQRRQYRDQDDGKSRTWDVSTGQTFGAGDWVFHETLATNTTRDDKIVPKKEFQFIRFEREKIVEIRVFTNELHTLFRLDQVRAEDFAPLAPSSNSGAGSTTP